MSGLSEETIISLNHVLEKFQSEKLNHVHLTNWWLQKLVMKLWHHESREEKYLAIQLSKHFPEQIGFKNLRVYERMIREGPWRDFVDDVAVNLVGVALSKSPEEMWNVLDKWNRDEHLWIRRASLLCQLKFKDSTNEKKLLEYCNNLKDEANINIKSAIE